MTASDWKNKIVAIVRAADAGDDKPLGIVSETLAAMWDLCNPSPQEATETVPPMILTPFPSMETVMQITPLIEPEQEENE